MNTQEDRKRKIYAEKKKIYNIYKELSDIDPNLLKISHLKFVDYLTFSSIGGSLLYFYPLREWSKLKKLSLILPIWIFINLISFRYYYIIYPEIILKNTKIYLENKKENMKYFNTINNENSQYEICINQTKNISNANEFISNTENKI